MISRKGWRGQSGTGAATNWVVLTLIALFCALAISLIALGGQAYRAIVRRADSNTALQTTVGYALSRVRAFDHRGAVRIEQALLNGETVDVLTLNEEIEGETYQTRLYCAGGALREQFVNAEIPLEQAEDGEALAQLQAFSVRQEDGMLVMTFVTEDAVTQVVHAALRSAGEGAL